MKKFTALVALKFMDGHTRSPNDRVWRRRQRPNERQLSLAIGTNLVRFWNVVRRCDKRLFRTACLHSLIPFFEHQTGRTTFVLPDFSAILLMHSREHAVCV